jgi:hypothetical protein
MGLADTVRGVIALAHGLVGGAGNLEVDVWQEAWTGQTPDGTPTYAAPVKRSALVELEQREVKSFGGEIATSNATLTLLEPAPVAQQDRFTYPPRLPDGSLTTGPILNYEGLIDPQTGQPFFTRVFIG